MKYLVATFHFESTCQDMQACFDLLADCAAEAGFDAFDEPENGLMKAYVQKDLFDRQLLDEQLRNFPIPGTKVSYSIIEAEDKDWNQEWEEQGFAPITIADKVVVYDAKHQKPHKASSTNIIAIGIETKLAFGTGSHETTRMVIAALLDLGVRQKRVLDCGTGTGILGIVASKLGAKSVAAYDIDEWSVDNAKHNAALNKVQNMEVLMGNATVINHISGFFDIVMANINRNILLADMKAFRSVINEGSYLVLSGFYEDDACLLVKEAESLGMKEVDRKTENRWCCLLLKG